MTETAVPLLNLVNLADHTYYDVPTVLRSIADGIERGDYGEVREGGIVLRNTERELSVFAGGWRSSPARTHLLFALAGLWIEDQML